MIKLVVFDWNGVLIADAQATVDIDNRLLKSFGRKPITLAKYRNTFTMPVKNFFLALGFSEAEMREGAKKIQETFHAHYEPRIAGVRTRSGARELLEWLSKQKIECIILSNHTLPSIQAHVKRLGLETYFSRIIANDMHATMVKKNKAGKLLDLLKGLPYKRNEALIIGDSPEEAEAGKLAGIATVGITGGYYSVKRLKEAQPDYLIHNLRELISIIKQV